MIFSQQRNVLRLGFTLVELLVSITIIGIIGGMVSIALAGANKQAKLTKARSQNDRLNLVIMQLYEEESLRNVAAISGATRRLPANAIQENPRSRNSRALAILNWKRDYLRCSMPDSLPDVISDPILIRYQQYDVPSGNNVLNSINLDIPVTAGGLDSLRGIPLQRIRQRIFQLIRVKQLETASTVPADFAACHNGNATDGEWTPENQSAECLYTILAINMVNGRPALESLRSSDIADTDEDGVPEIADSWDHAVGFIRWPAGFYLHPKWIKTVGPGVVPAPLNDTELASLKPTLGNDPLDLLGVDPRLQDTSLANHAADDTFYMVPMVVSAGPDGIFDMLGLDVPSTYDYTSNRNDSMQQYLPAENRFDHALPVSPAHRFIDPFTHDSAATFTSVQRYGACRDDLNFDEDVNTDNTGDNLYPNFSFRP
jgi:prepilin-type N-terminal cleavage/methylation domain-containing protein